MTSLKVGDLVELRAGTGTVGTVLDVVESQESSRTLRRAPYSLTDQADGG
jgi:hypothetical protein